MIFIIGHSYQTRMIQSLQLIPTEERLGRMGRLGMLKRGETERRKRDELNEIKFMKPRNKNSSSAGKLYGRQKKEWTIVKHEKIWSTVKYNRL